MHIAGTFLLYALVGVCIATALVLRESSAGAARKVASFLGAALFWPIFAPLMWSSPAAPAAPSARKPQPQSALSPRIRAAEEQLLAALGKVDGVAEDILAPEVARVRSVTGQLASMESRVAEMDALLASPEFNALGAQKALEDLAARGVPEVDPRMQSVRSRLRNIDRLKSMRARTCEDLERVVLKIEEMSSQLQLLKFAGRPDAEVVALIKDIAECVEDVTENLLATSQAP
jgi:hypothetical protein